SFLVTQVLTENAPDAARSLQDTALSQALVLRHFHNACFSPSKHQRFISRWLCALWMCDSAGAGELLRRLVPAGMLQYLRMPVLSPAELQCLNELEDEIFD
ncbi:unnamed protein product, partial [Phaeothamnion confervicola]